MNAEYAPNIEFGTKNKKRIPSDLSSYASQFKGKPEGKGAKKKIYEWAKRKGLFEFRYPIYREIMENGINPHPFFFKHRGDMTKLLGERMVANLTEE